MKSVLKTFLVGAALCTITLSSASAEIFYVEDQGNRFSLSFPDLWAVTQNQKPDDKLTVTGPGEYKFANCRVRVREDRRYLIYPRKFASSVQKVAYSKQFWDEYLGEYDDVTLQSVTDGAGLGQGFATYAEATFTTAENPIVHKRAIMFASLYYDNAYIVECSTEQTVYDQWRPAFLSIVKSVDFTRTTAIYPSGHYRKFLNDPELIINGPNKLDSDHF
ncbi:MAG: hypothetical protein KDI13_04840 [Alphaproteobacteria bacterium]|nr:hypothetical protein [Alphaproteobacteria bacterium]